MGGCQKDVPIEEKLMNYDDMSTVYMPVVKTGNIGLDSAINENLEKMIKDNFEKVKDDRDGVTTEGFTAFSDGDLLSIFHEGYFEPKGKPNSAESYLLTFHVNSKNGKFYTIKDLFKKDYEEELINRLTKVLDLSLGEFHLTFRPDITSCAFDVYDNEIVFIFSPETVAPAHYGFIDAALSFNQLDDLLDKQGEFYSVITANNKQSQKP